MSLRHYLGISAGFHDAATAVVRSDGEIVHAAHSERYSGLKNDQNLHPAQLAELAADCEIDHIAYYERPWAKQLRRLRSGEGFDWQQCTLRQVLRSQLQGRFDRVPSTCYPHHLSHAAAGFQTSPFEQATVVVIDAIGEWDTVSIWAADYRATGQARYCRLWAQQYPHSIGLFYSAITDRVGLKPMDEEYITMGMAAYGSDPDHTALGMEAELVASVEHLRFKDNLHAGLAPDFMWSAEPEDIAAGAQRLAETLIYAVMARARSFGFSTNLVYAGGVALNCLANRNLNEYFENIWIMPSPGDSGSSLGAAALAYGRRLVWRGAYLGTAIGGAYPRDACLDSLLSVGICGVASGRAEFGPRSLGNRSLLADPRGSNIKEQVNAIKQRQQFRPFAPAVLAEHVDEYFDVPSGWVDGRYMQIIARCRRPDLFPAVTHVDGTSRLQIVPQDDSGIRHLLEAWYHTTGCPMLLNTSLNIRGCPQVNDRSDADRFEQQYGVRVHS